MKEEKEETKISGKQIKLVIFIVIIALVVFLLLWGMTPTKIYEVSEIYDESTHIKNAKEISVKGLVADFQSGAGNFTLVDSLNGNITIEISHGHPFPEGFGNNETVVVTGIINKDGSIYHIQSSAIQIGCPSKY